MRERGGGLRERGKFSCKVSETECVTTMFACGLLWSLEWLLTPHG